MRSRSCVEITPTTEPSSATTGAPWISSSVNSRWISRIRVSGLTTMRSRSMRSRARCGLVMSSMEARSVLRMTSPRGEHVATQRDRREECPLFGGHVRVELVREILDPRRHLVTRAREELPERRVLGDVLLQHPVDHLRAPRRRALEQAPDHRSLGLVVKPEFSAQDLEREVQIATDAFSGQVQPSEARAVLDL